MPLTEQGLAKLSVKFDSIEDAKVANNIIRKYNLGTPLAIGFFYIIDCQPNPDCVPGGTEQLCDL